MNKRYKNCLKVGEKNGGYKFLDTIKIATGKEVEKPIQLSQIEDKKEKFDIIENSNSEVKNYILSKIQ